MQSKFIGTFHKEEPECSHIFLEVIIETIISFDAHSEIVFPHWQLTYTNLMDRVLLHPLLKDQVNIYESVIWLHLLLITLD